VVEDPAGVGVAEADGVADEVGEELGVGLVVGEADGDESPGKGVDAAFMSFQPKAA